MAITMSLASAVDAAPALLGALTPGLPSVPTTRSVPSLEAALRDIRRLGGTVTLGDEDGAGHWFMGLHRRRGRRRDRPLGTRVGDRVAREREGACPLGQAPWSGELRKAYSP